MKKMTAILMVALLVVAFAASTASAASGDFVLDRLTNQTSKVVTVASASDGEESKDGKQLPKPGTPGWKAFWH